MTPEQKERALKIAPDKYGHRTRMSDSSIYDEVCVLCGARDAYGSVVELERPCPNAIKEEPHDK